MHLHNEFATLMLRLPEGCGTMMSLIWRQQISVLERVELEDDGVDVGHSIVSFYLCMLPFLTRCLLVESSHQALGCGQLNVVVCITGCAHW